MEKETITRHTYEQFLDGVTVSGAADLDLMEREDQSVPEQVSKDQRRLWAMGIVAMLGGAGLLAVSNLGIFSEAWPYCLGAAAVGAGMGLVRLMKRIFRKNTLTFPTLELRRKTERVNRNAMSTLGIMPRVGLAKSATDRVIMGVCGGLAESSGINATLIRALVIFIFAITSGIGAIFYFGLGMILPTRKK
jgi:phage shock protein C